ncbi:MAG TPA: hypothetical protein VKY74_21665 [Chloroflexia bacterium]|nr:hypothetical protein [Chloroflexia bacterium]
MRAGTGARALLALLGGLALLGYGALWAAAGPAGAAGPVTVYLIIGAGLFALYLLAAYLVLRAGSALAGRRTLVAILGVAALARAILVFASPTLSDDMYRYIWDGRVQAAGLSPYAYPPGAPQVAALHPPSYTLWGPINRKSAITIYPPGAELFYAGLYRLWPDSVAATKGALVALDLLTCVLLVGVLQRLGLPAARVLVYAWAPLPIVEFGGNGHIEALEVCCTALALWAGVVATQQGGPAARRSGTALLATGALAAAVLVKLIPVLLLAAWARRLGLKLVVLGLALCALVAGAFAVAHGGSISPFLATYLGSESFNAPLYYFLTQEAGRLGGVSDGVIRAGLLLALGLIALVLAARPDRGPYDFIGKSFILVGAYLVLATNAHPWYFTWWLVFVPLLLPPGGLPTFPPSPSLKGAGSESARWRRGDYGPALAALAYGGLAAAGYTVFAWRLGTVPAPLAALQLAVLLGPGLLWPVLGRLAPGRRARPLAGAADADQPPTPATR